MEAEFQEVFLDQGFLDIPEDLELVGVDAMVQALMREIILMV